MKITIKTLQQKSFTIIIDENETVLALKQRIEAEQGPNYAVGSLKLIYSGKILNDANKLNEYNIQETSFVVVMVSKAKPPAKPQTTTTPTISTVAPSTSQTSGSAETTAAATEVKPQQETTPPATGATQQSSTTAEPMEQTDSTTPSTSTTTSQQPQSSMLEAASVLVTGSEYESALDRLMGMGYTRDQCMRAMQASFNNPDRAAEYLLEGKADMELPVGEQEGQQESRESGEGGEQPSAEVVGGRGSSGSSGEAGGGGGAGGADLFQVLLQVPQFQRLRGEISRNPAILQMVLQQIRQTNPPLFEAISQNQDEFLRFLNDPSGTGSGEEAGTGVGGGRVPQGLPGIPGMPQGPPGTVSIPVTQEEKEAIDRLRALGFPEHEVIEAYFACDKNEELAANFLFQYKEN